MGIGPDQVMKYTYIISFFYIGYQHSDSQVRNSIGQGNNRTRSPASNPRMALTASIMIVQVKTFVVVGIGVVVGYSKWEKQALTSFQIPFRDYH